MEELPLRQLELFKDDSLVAVYSDGSKLLLSACGAAFLYVDSTSRHQPCPSKIQQITQFAVSRYRHKLQSALEFRNKFAERPFLCDVTGKGQKEIRNTSVESVTWPLCPHCITKTSTGNLLLHSLDKNACIELMRNGRVFTVTYWAPLSSRRNGNETQQGVMHHLLTHWYSVSDVPEAWACLLELLITAASNNTECCHSNKQVFSVLPCTLPVMCRNVHLHCWDKSITHQPGISDMLKIVWSDDVTYRLAYSDHVITVMRGNPFRLLWDKQCVEAYPNQNTVIASCDPQGRYYDMWCTNDRGETNQYKICYDQLPQYKQFSVSAVVGRMSRLLQAMAGWNGGIVTQSVCWMVNNEDVPAMPVKQELVKEEASITEVGRFMAYHSGRIYIAFVDKTILEMHWSQTTGGHCCNNKLLLHDHLPPGYCRLLLSNGQYQMLPVVRTPQPYQRYVEYAVQWGQWAYCEHNRHSDTFTVKSGLEYNSVALGEVAKIRQLLENSLASASDGIEGSSHSSIVTTPTHPTSQDSHQQPLSNI